MTELLVTEEDLASWFVHYNFACFDGLLPRVRVNFSPDTIFIGSSGKPILGGVRQSSGNIVISRSIQFSPCLCRGTLLHEMVHLKRRRYAWLRKRFHLRRESPHGSGFTRDIKELVAQGVYDELL